MNAQFITRLRWNVITKPVTSLVLVSLAMVFALAESFAATTPPFRLLHSFEGPPNDGYLPDNRASLVGTGAVLYGMTTSGGRTTNGVVFKVNTDGSGYQVLRHFEGYNLFFAPNGPKNDGALPYGGLVLSGSALYGTTSQGGSNGLGTVFKMNTDGSGFQILHHFNNTPSVRDGYIPHDQLTLVGSTLYGTTASGGAGFSDGVVFRVNTDGSDYRVLHSFVPNGTEGAVPHGPLLVIGSTIYGVAELGGTGGSGIAFRMNTDGTGYQILHQFTGVSTDGASPVGGLLLLGSTLYGATRNGGPNAVGTVFAMGTNGTGFRLLHTFAVGEAWSPVAGLAASGMTLYGMTRNGSAPGTLGNGTLFQINPDGMGYQIVHTFRHPIDMNDGTFPSGAPFILGSTLYGVAGLGGARGVGCVFAQSLTSNAPPGMVTVTLSPMSATNTIGSTHTVTATVTSNGVLKAGVPVTFRVLTGPNINRTGSGTTSAKGQASFTYTGTGGTGVDVIQAFVNVPGVSAGAVAGKIWVPAPPVPHDLTVTKLTVTKVLTLTAAKPSLVKPVKVTFQNRSQHSETIADTTTLSNLLTLTIESLGSNCPSPPKIISPRTIASLPRTLKPNQSFTAQFDVTYNCGNDPLKSAVASPGHEDFRYTARVNHAALGNADTTPSNDVCPRPPNPAIGDKGCGNIDPATGQLGAAVWTDVVVK